MSNSESNTSPVDPPSKYSGYDLMLADIDLAIDEIREKIENGRVRSPEHDKTRIKYYRAMGYLVRSKAKVMESQQLEELQAEIEELKEERE